MTGCRTAGVVLATAPSTRVRSQRSKVLQELAGEAFLGQRTLSIWWAHS